MLSQVATHTPSRTMAVKGGGLLDGALPDMDFEMEYQFTASVEECRASLLQLGVRVVYAASVAKVVGVMARTHTGLHIALCPRHLISVEVFIESVHKLQKENLFELDHPVFFVKDRVCLILLM